MNVSESIWLIYKPNRLALFIHYPFIFKKLMLFKILLTKNIINFMETPINEPYE